MKPALLLIDIQNDYFSGGKFELHKPVEAANKAAQALDYFRAKGLPVFYAQHIFPSDDAPFFQPSDAHGIAINEIVAPKPGEKVIVKHIPDCFPNTDLDASLKAAGVDTLVICGNMSHICVDTTVRSATVHGYQVILLHDACTCPAVEWQGQTLDAQTVHAAFMGALAFFFADAVAVDDLAAKLS